MTRWARAGRLALGVLLAAAGCAGPTAGTRTPDALPNGFDLSPTHGDQIDATPCPIPTAGVSAQVPEAIYQRGYLVAGVDQSDLSMSYRDPASGQIEGFNIDLLTAIVTAIWPSDPPTDHLRFVSVRAGDGDFKRLSEDPKDGGIDVIATSLTATCKRDAKVAFSDDYLDSGQTVLVRRLGPGKPEYPSVDALAGHKVCAAAHTTSLDHIAAYPVTPRLIPVAATSEIDCLVMLRQHQADAVSTDENILQGFLKLDPDTMLVTDPPAHAPSCAHHDASPCTWFAAEPHALAFARTVAGFQLQRFANHVLADLRRDSGWAKIHHTWLPDHPDDGNPGGPTPS
jgi:polar amino acid transport system substrate-binding protein